MGGDAQLRLFVYGTLKRGFENHRKLCQGVRSVEAAEIGGKVYALPAGYPALVIPKAAILSLGTADGAADVATQFRLQAEVNAGPHSADDPATLVPGLDRVHGEILTFDDGPSRLAKFDQLEDFRPGRQSAYLRVLAQVFTRRSQEAVVSWVYVMSDPGPRAMRLRGGRWPER
jgi:gamma-glutamylcyclotransferase (GGCT)/AIG2-like uncharacterized protein YtfP